MAHGLARQQLFKLRCSPRDDELDVWVVASGEEAMLYEGQNGDPVMTYPDEDPVWDEVGQILRDDLSIRDDVAYANAFHRVFPVTIDGNEERRYREEIRPPCPGQSGSRVTFWGPVNPPMFRDVRVPVVTHLRWLTLSHEARLAAVREALRGHRGG